MHFFALFA